MGIKERRARERAQMKVKIMQVAIELADAGGWTAVSVRKIANQIEYSTQKIYELFNNKDEIILALLRSGFSQLAENMERSAAQTNNLEEAGYAIARTYCQFAWENQTLYRIMYGLDGVPFGVSETWQEGMKIGEIAAEVLGDIYPDQSYEELYNNVEIFWGTMHGIIALTMADRISGGQKKAQILIRQAAAHLMNQ